MSSEELAKKDGKVGTEATANLRARTGCSLLGATLHVPQISSNVHLDAAEKDSARGFKDFESHR
jgi:hypothetical protein